MCKETIIAKQFIFYVEVVQVQPKEMFEAKMGEMD
jgi:hypothetical protein